MRIADVRDFGARGDGVAIDSAAIAAAIAAMAGGGTVLVPPGRYLCFLIRLHGGVTILLQAGATIVAADPACGSAWKRDPGGGVIGVEKGPLIPVF